MLRAPGADDARMSWILEETNKAQAELDRKVLEAQALPDTHPGKVDRLRRYRAMKTEVDQTFLNLDRSMQTWASRDVDSMYRSGWMMGAFQTGGGMDFNLVHKEAARFISDNAYNDVATGLLTARDDWLTKISAQELYEGMDPGQILAIQDKSRSAVAQALLTGEADPRKVAKGLADELWEDGIQITDAGGRKWGMENYTRMLVRTKSANAYNAGSLNKYSEEGITRVSVYDGIIDDEECADANGKVWSLRYAQEHPIAHPNCRRAFAPKPGRGLTHQGEQGDQKPPSSKSSIKRTAIGADFLFQILREFRQPEEFQASSFVAAAATRAVGDMFGIPPGALLFLDEFISGFLARPLREIDELIEATINPAIYGARLVEALPSPEQLSKLKTAQDVAKAVAKAVTKAGAGTFTASDITHNKAVNAIALGIVSRGLDNAQRMGLIDADLAWIIRAVRSEKLNFLDVLGSPNRSVNHFGRVTSEILRQYSLGNATDLRVMVRTSRATIDQMIEARRLINAIHGADADAARHLWNDTDQKIRTMEAVLNRDIRTMDELHAVDFVNRVFDPAADSATAFDLPSDTQLAEVIQEMQRVRAYADQRVYETSLVLQKNGLPESKVLLRRAARSSLDDGITPANAFISNSELVEVVDDLGRKLAAVEAGGFNQEAWDDLAALVERLYTKAATDEDYAKRVLPGIIGPNETNEINLRLLGYVDANDIPIPTKLTRLESLQLLDEHMGRFVILSKSGDTPGGAFYDGVRVAWDGPEIEAVVRAMERVDAEFLFRADVSWVQDILDSNDPRQLYRVLGDISDKHDMADATGALFYQMFLDVDAAQLDRVFANALVANERILSSSDIRRVLGEIYGHGNVTTIGTGTSASGPLFLVTDELGRSFVVKSIHATMGSGPPSEAILSYGLSQWMDDLLGGGASIPLKVVKFDDHDLYLGVMPFLHDGATLEGIVEDVAVQSNRRIRLFDLLTMETDGHGGNTLARLRNLIGYSIDNEGSMGAHKLITGEPFVGGALGGHSAISRRTMIDRAIRDWKPGYTDDMAEAAGPVRLVKLTGSDAEAFTAQVGGEVVVDTARTRVDLLHNYLPFVADTRGTPILPIGRVTSFEVPDLRGAPRALSGPRVLITPRERVILQQMIDGDDALRASLETEIRSILGDMTDDTLSKLLYSYGEDLDGMVEQMTELSMGNMQRQATQLVDTGLLAPDRVQETVSRGGVRLVVGDGFDAADEFDTTSGLVNAIFTDSNGDLIVEYYPGIGTGKKPGDVLNEGTQLIRKKVDDLFPTVEASENFQMASKVDNTQEALAKAADIEPTHATALGFAEEQRTAVTRVLSEDGIHIGDQREWIPMHVEGRLDDGLRLVDDTGAERTVTWSEVVDSGILQDMVEEELLAIPDTHRPRQVTFYLNKLETEDGVPALGFYDPSTRHMHLSLVGGLGEGRLAGNRNAFRVDFPEDGNLYQILSDLMDDELRDGPFRRLIRHELGHAVEVGIEEADKAEITRRVWIEVLEELEGFTHHEASMETQINLLKLIPEDFPVDEFDTFVDALVAYRVQLIEDVMHTNTVHQVNDLFEEALTGGELPTWAARAYDEVLRRESDSHHEFFAELYARVIASGGNDAAITKAARELGVDEATVRQIVFRDIPDLPSNWDSLSDEFTDWVLEVLDARSRNVVPRTRSANRRLWKKAKLETDGIVEDIRRQLDPSAPEGTGATVHIITGERPATGTMVARGANEQIIKNVDPEDLPKHISKYARTATNRNFLDDPSNKWFLGVWIEPDGTVTLDVVMQFDSPIDAAIFGFKEGQRQGFSIDSGVYEKYLDGYSDFQSWWDDVGRKAHELRIGRKTTAAEEDALTQRVGAAFANLVPANRREIRGRGGKHLPVGMDVYDEDGQRILTHAFENRYVYAEPKIVKGRTEWVPTEESINMTKRKAKNRIRSVLELADEQYGFVDRALPDAEWNAARRIKVTGNQKAVREVFDSLDRMGVDIPRGTFDGRNGDEVIREVARLLDPRGTKGRRLRGLGFDESFDEAFELVMTGRASEELATALLGFNFAEGVFSTTGLIDIAEGKALRIVHRFYEDWHGQYKRASIREGHQMQKLVGVAAGLSPGMLAEVNRDAAIFMLNTIKANPQIRGTRVTDLKDFIRGQIENIRKESIRKSGYVTQKQLDRIDHLEFVIRNIRGGYLSEMGDDAGAFAVAMLAFESGQDVLMTDGSIARLTMVGAYGMPQVVRAYKLATGSSPIDDVLGNTKTRSFFNNIMDPKDLYGAGDVTIDFHMANAAFRIIGMQDIFHAQPNVLGMEAGLRPIIGDIVRELFAEGWGDRVHSDSPAELQEVIWAIWRAIAVKDTKGTLSEEELRWLGGHLRRVQIDPRWKKP